MGKGDQKREREERDDDDAKRGEKKKTMFLRPTYTQSYATSSNLSLFLSFYIP